MSVSDLYRFSASSANDDKYTHLWFKGAKLFIEQLNTFLKYTNYKSNIIDINLFENKNSSELAQVLNKYGSDKASCHNYNIIYSYIINDLDRYKPLNILEIGMGTNNPSLVSTMGASGAPGASLRAWQDYLPNANIFGADIDMEILFNKERIRTHYVDQLDMSTYNVMQNNFKVKYDMIIDDGLHSIGANLNTLLFALENINDGGWIVIEDIANGLVDNWFPVEFMLKQNTDYEVKIIKTRLSHIFVVHKLKKHL